MLEQALRYQIVEKLDWLHCLSWDSMVQKPALPVLFPFPFVGLDLEKGGLLEMARLPLLLVQEPHHPRHVHRY